MQLLSSFIHAITTTPAESQTAPFVLFTCDSGLPRNIAGSASASFFSGPAQCSLTLRPACSPSSLRTLYTRGFSRFVTSTSAPVATGRNENYRTGFAPARKQRLGTAHYDLELRLLSSTGITRFHRYYGPIRHPTTSSLSLAGVQLVSRLTTCRGFPCCVSLPLPYMPSPLPRRNC